MMQINLIFFLEGHYFLDIQYCTVLPGHTYSTVQYITTYITHKKETLQTEPLQKGEKIWMELQTLNSLVIHHL